MILLQFSMWKAELQVTLDNHVELMLSFQMKIFPPNCELIFVLRCSNKLMIANLR